MKEAWKRTEALLGKDAMEKLKNAHVAVFGLGGVGGYVVEGLVRCGVGALTLVDGDKIAESNLNRQILATSRTLGKEKATVAKDRAKEINPEIQINAVSAFFSKETADAFDFSHFSYVVDAVDDVQAKIEIIARAKSAGVPVVSAMGAGNKLDPTAFEVADIEKTSVCPLARVVRRELKKRGISGVKTVFSKEEPKKPSENGQTAPSSVSFVPPVMGLILAGEVIKDLANI